MNDTMEFGLRHQLIDRRRRLESTISEIGEAADLVRLLKEVDSALRRLDGHNHGQCLVCHTAIGIEVLQDNPLAQYCLCDLSREQQVALQHDLDLASSVQLGLLPKQNIRHAGWEVHFRYLPAGPVSGDYCDVIVREGDGLFFLVGDVSGKGVAASLFMARLNALFRSLVQTGQGVDAMVDTANRLLVESAIPSHYATLACGRAQQSGRVEISNAGHCRPLIVHDGKVSALESSGFPLGLFEEGPYAVDSVDLHVGDTIFLHTDGLSEARNGADQEYGPERIREVLERNQHSSPQTLATECLRELDSFTAGAPLTDDLTIMVLRRSPDA
jgi:phosphoserine phosphatase RsbU/P